MCFTHVEHLAELHERLQMLDQDTGHTNDGQSITNIAQSIIGRIPRQVANYTGYHQSPFERTPPEEEEGASVAGHVITHRMLAQTNPT